MVVVGAALRRTDPSLAILTRGRVGSTLPRGISDEYVLRGWRWVAYQMQTNTAGRVPKNNIL